MKQVIRVLVGMVMVLALASAQAEKPQHVESPPEGIHPSEFATQYEGCLGQLRSLIARGKFAGIGPFGEHFTGEVNPGRHQGTVGEEEFLRNINITYNLGIEDLSAFCAQFSSN